MLPFLICPPIDSHIPFSGRLCMPALSVCFWTPRLSLGHTGSLTSVHKLASTDSCLTSLAEEVALLQG